MSERKNSHGLTQSRSSQLRSAKLKGFVTEPNSLLTNSQWYLINDVSKIRNGRWPAESYVPVRQRARMLIWILFTGAYWNERLSRYPCFRMCRRYLSDWTELGMIVIAWQRRIGNSAIAGPLNGRSDGFRLLQIHCRARIPCLVL